MLRVAVKCNLCSTLRKTGLEPACSSICPAGAIVYGEKALVFDRVKKRTAEVIAGARFEAFK